MNLTKALKLKKKLIAKTERLSDRFHMNNSHKESHTPNYDPESTYKEWVEASEELVNLKWKIIAANVPIYGKIFTLSELKYRITKLRHLDTKSGEVDSYRKDNEPEVYVAFMNEVERDKVIENLEEEIDNIQSEIESFNSVTNI